MYVVWYVGRVKDCILLLLSLDSDIYRSFQAIATWKLFRIQGCDSDPNRSLIQLFILQLQYFKSDLWGGKPVCTRTIIRVEFAIRQWSVWKEKPVLNKTYFDICLIIMLYLIESRVIQCYFSPPLLLSLLQWCFHWLMCCRITVVICCKGYFSACASYSWWRRLCTRSVLYLLWSAGTHPATCRPVPITITWFLRRVQGSV